MAATLDQLLREFRRAILALDTDTARQLIRAHRTQLAAMSPALRDLTATLRAAGTIDNAARWVRDIDAAQRLLTLAEQGMADFGSYAAQQIEARRLELIQLAAQHDQAITYASLVGNAQITPGTANAIRAALSAIPVEAVTQAVGALQPASALRNLFDGFGQQASRKLGEALVDGITRGQGAEQIARAMRDSLDGNAARALTVARTETHRAYRSASLERYRAQPEVYSGWTWDASLDSRTCPVCVAKHGSEHSLDEDFGSHVNCRCRPLPRTRSLVDILGDDPEVRELQETIDGMRGTPETGPEWFARQPVEAQREIVGPLKLDALQSGRITLDDVVVERVDPDWGLGHRTASLAESLANANARRG